MSHTVQNFAAALPCVVQIGFAGSRQLFGESPEDPNVERQWGDAVTEQVVQLLKLLPAKLKLSPHHFLCGISQIACGADSVFTRACLAHEPSIPQRIFLPQLVDDYLSAVSSNGTPDFTPAQMSEAKSLLDSPHIVQLRVVSQSQERSDRFRETNAEILRVSDMVVCLLSSEAAEKAGGTNELLKRALAVNKPVLEIRVTIEDGQPVCHEMWHVTSPFDVPAIPEPLSNLQLPKTDAKIPSSEQYRVPLKNLVSTQAKQQQRLFRYAAAIIIATHILATFCATGALALHGHHTGTALTQHQSSAPPADGYVPHAVDNPPAAEEPSGGQPTQKPHAAADADRLIPLLLGIEFVLLFVGFGVHQYLHHSQAARIWANARLVAEMARSIRAIDPRHLYLEYLFRLPLPRRFRPLARTLNVLHLKSTYSGRNNPWPPQRDKYVVNRIGDQITFYAKAIKIDKRWLKWCRGMFFVCSILAMAATIAKLGLLAATWGSWEFAMWPQLLGTLAVVLPVLAVGGLSWAAALDYEARGETFSETLAFLKRQKELLLWADTVAEFDRLVLETESVLLGEVGNWFSRRANAGVA